MFFLIAFLIAGAVTLGVQKMAPIIAGLTPLALVLVALNWINEKSGINDFIMGSWHSMAGTTESADLTACGMWPSLLNLVLSIVAIVFAVAAIAGLPVGLAVTIYGCGEVLFTLGKAHTRLLYGMAGITIGFLGVFVAGTLYGLMHDVATSTCA